jgi:hypothetical protein
LGEGRFSGAETRGQKEGFCRSRGRLCAARGRRNVGTRGRGGRFLKRARRHHHGARANRADARARSRPRLPAGTEAEADDTATCSEHGAEADLQSTDQDLQRADIHAAGSILSDDAPEQAAGDPKAQTP